MKGVSTTASQAKLLQLTKTYNNKASRAEISSERAL